MRKGADACPSRPLPAEKVEGFVVDQIRRIGKDPVLRAETFRQTLAQIAAERRGAKAERKRIEKEIATARGEVTRMLATLSRTTGPAADAVRAEVEKNQGNVATLDTRLAEVRAREAALAAQSVDESDVARALEAFDPIWDVLLTSEKERLLRLLVERVSYDGSDQKLEITFAPAGIASLVAEVGGEAS